MAMNKDNLPITNIDSFTHYKGNKGITAYYKEFNKTRIEFVLVTSGLHYLEVNYLHEGIKIHYE